MRYRILFFVLLAYFITSFGGITYGPYLTCPTTDGATVQFGKELWDDAEIYWADSMTYATSGTLPNSADITEIDTRAFYTITGYAPSTRIYYRVVAGSDESPVYNFRTMPELGDSVHFCAYGDTRTNEAIHTDICQKIAQHNPLFVIHSGDLIADAWSTDDWDGYFDATDTISHYSPFITAIGNHEIPYDIYKIYFKLPGNEEWYALHLGCVSVISLNLYTDYTSGNSQYNWLEATLADSIPTSTRWIIINEHESPYSTSNHGSNITVREHLKPLYDAYGVDVVFAGHDHCYEHSYVDGIHYIVTGGGGAPLYSVPGGEYTICCESVHHFIILDADTADLCLTVFRQDETILEEFCLSDFPVRVPIIPISLTLYVKTHPNPFNSSCNIDIFDVGIYSGSKLNVKIFDLYGKKIWATKVKINPPQDIEEISTVAEIKARLKNKDDHRIDTSRPSAEIIWRPDQKICSGVYFVRVETPDKTQITKRIIYLK